MIDTPFLKLVADDLIKKYGAELSELVVVFPNNRAKVFFNQYLVDIVEKPIWSPSYSTIQKLFQQHSELQIADPIKLVCLLYRVYQNVMAITPFDDSDDIFSEETLDTFYHWGEILLSDFEDVDNNMVDAKMLFQNIQDSIPFENDHTYLSDEQRQTLERFFEIFKDGGDTKLKRRFLALWRILYPVYDQFKELLLTQKIAYEGMLKRSVVERMEKDGVDWKGKKYVFVGFNVLNQCEKRLFQLLKKAGKALFYWDCDEFYINGKDLDGHDVNREAGLFMRDNIIDFPNELPTLNLLKEKRDVLLIGSSTENAQARYVADFLHNCPKDMPDEDAVVVLCNESLLLPVLHSVPMKEDNAERKVNVTMGLPLVQTPMYGLIQLLLSYQERLFFLDVKQSSSLLSTTILPLLRNHYLRTAFPQLQEIDDKIQKQNWRYFKNSDLLSLTDAGILFQRCNDSISLLNWLQNIVRSVATLFKNKDEDSEEMLMADEEVSSLYNDLYKESLYRIFTMLNRLSSLCEEKVLEVDFSMMLQLIETVLSSTSIPFTGEESKGLQVMGFLETRNLDFSHVLLLSANEGVLPKSGKENSFIPYSLRKGYGMTTIEHKNALYAYYFYRLIQRAEQVTILYNISTENSSKGQMSRFLMQMLVESNYNIKRCVIATDTPINESNNIVIEKTDAIIDKLKSMFDKNRGGKHRFSPSQLNDLLDCSLFFYLKYVLKLGKQEEVSDDVKKNEFGTVFHATMEYFYQDLMTDISKRGRRVINMEDYPEDFKNKEFRYKIEKYVDRAFREHYFNIKDPKETMPQMSGLQLLNRDAVVRMVIRMLEVDKQYAPFSILGTELDITLPVTVTLNDGEEISVQLHGQIDRVDQKEGVTRILDYKTGGESSKIDSIDKLFFNEKSRYNYGLQVMLYCWAYSLNNKNELVTPAIAYLKNCKSPENLVVNTNKGPLQIANDYFDEISQNFQLVIRQLFDPSYPFQSSKKNCQYCDFKSYCGEKESKF